MTNNKQKLNLTLLKLDKTQLIKLMKLSFSDFGLREMIMRYANASDDETVISLTEAVELAQELQGNGYTL